jgi:AraC family transcriptional regulator of adaptative response / methylphosphotriester-DNA alkyltransferase methyltransferase
LVIEKHYYGVTTTKIFCRFGCPSKTPKPENVLYFGTLNEALEAGFRACKRCSPELSENPMMAFQKFILEQVFQIGARSPEITIVDLAKEVHLSKRQLERIVKTATGLSPKKFLSEKNKDYEI